MGINLTVQHTEIIIKSLTNTLRSMEHTNKKLPSVVNENRINKMNEIKNLIELMEENKNGL